jgi:hypothetical protein
MIRLRHAMDTGIEAAKRIIIDPSPLSQSKDPLRRPRRRRSEQDTARVGVTKIHTVHEVNKRSSSSEQKIVEIFRIQKV